MALLLSGSLRGVSGGGSGAVRMQNIPVNRQGGSDELPIPRAPVRPAVEIRTIPAAAAEATFEEIIHHIDDLDLAAFLRIAHSFGRDRYGYVVTPNVDHLIRCHEDPAYRAIYRAADFALLDSRFTAYWLRFTKGLRLPVCPGSDLFPELLQNLVQPSDRLVLIGGTERQAATLAHLYGLSDLRHYNPPMGFIRNPMQVEQCLEFVEAASPFRFCFLMVGAPQQEQIAHQLKQRDRARGLVFCLGASLNFVTGAERRAPVWMRRFALEWLYRLSRDPKRLAGRYLVRGPRIFGHLRRARVVLRTTSA